MLVETANQAASHQTVASALFLLFDGFLGGFRLVQLLFELMITNRESERKRQIKENEQEEEEYRSGEIDIRKLKGKNIFTCASAKGVVQHSNILALHFSCAPLPPN